jgi:hypothetical protein
VLKDGSFGIDVAEGLQEEFWCKLTFKYLGGGIDVSFR